MLSARLRWKPPFFLKSEKSHFVLAGTVPSVADSSSCIPMVLIFSASLKGLMLRVVQK